MKGQDSLKSQRASACTLTPAVWGGAERESCRITSSSASDSGEMTDLVTLLTFLPVSDGFSVLYLAVVTVIQCGPAFHRAKSLA